MPTTASKGTLAEALLKVQAETPALQKNAINPHFKNKYISLDELMEQILPVLNQNKIVLTQSPGFFGDSTPTLRTTLTYAPTGEAAMSEMLLMLDKDNPQGQGSAITYARRYSLMAMLGLVADADDDATAATPKAARQAKPSQSSPSGGVL